MRDDARSRQPDVSFFLASYNGSMKEAAIQAAILDNLRLDKRYFWRSRPSVGFYRVGTPGGPDIIGCVEGSSSEVTDKEMLSGGQKDLLARFEPSAR